MLEFFIPPLQLGIFFCYTYAIYILPVIVIGLAVGSIIKFINKNQTVYQHKYWILFTIPYVAWFLSSAISAYMGLQFKSLPNSIVEPFLAGIAASILLSLKLIFPNTFKSKTLIILIIIASLITSGIAALMPGMPE